MPVTNDNVPTVDEIFGERRRLKDEAIRNFKFQDFLDTCYSEIDRAVCSRATDNCSDKQLGYRIKDLLRIYFARVIKSDLDDWISDYPTKAQLTREERLYDSKKQDES